LGFCRKNGAYGSCREAEVSGGGVGKKVAEGYVKSNPEGVLQRKIKRKAEGGPVDKTQEVELKSSTKKKEKVESSSKDAAITGEVGRSLWDVNFDYECFVAEHFSDFDEDLAAGEKGTFERVV
jgi:hypothetical protein